MSAEDSELDYSLEDIVAEDDEDEEGEEEYEEARMRESQGGNNHNDNQHIDIDENDDEEESCEIEGKIENHKETGSEEKIIIGKITRKQKNIFGLISRSQAASRKNIQITAEQKSPRNESNLLVYSRRLKSLEELSKRFLSVFMDKSQCLVSLDKITTQLGVERRRIYDIINILESLKLVSRNSKNNYNWNGIHSIYDTIAQYESQQFDDEQIMMMVIIPESTRREKSLEMLSIGFLKLFLYWKRMMTLEEAAQRLSEKSIEEHNIKTKIRRLYDIANVFKSLGLIQKTAIQGTKKPAFEWVGKKGVQRFTERIIQEKGVIINKDKYDGDIQGIQVKPSKLLKRSMILQQSTKEQIIKGQEVNPIREKHQEKSNIRDEDQIYKCNNIISSIQVQQTPSPSIRMVKRHINNHHNTSGSDTLQQQQQCCCCCCNCRYCCNSTGTSQTSSQLRRCSNSSKINCKEPNNIIPTQLLFEPSTQDINDTSLSAQVLNNPLIGSLVNLIAQNSQENQQQIQQISQAQYSSEQIHHQCSRTNDGSRIIGQSQQQDKIQQQLNKMSQDQQQQTSMIQLENNLMKSHIISNNNGNRNSTARKGYTNMDDENLLLTQSTSTNCTSIHTINTLNDEQDKTILSNIPNIKRNHVTILTQNNFTDKQLSIPPPPFRKSFSACNISNSKGLILPSVQTNNNSIDNQNVQNDSLALNSQATQQYESDLEQIEQEQQYQFSQVFQQLLSSTSSSQNIIKLPYDLQNYYSNEETAADKPSICLKQSQSTQFFD